MRFRHRHGMAALVILAAAAPAQAGDLGFWNARIEGRLTSILRVDRTGATPAAAGDLRFGLPLFGGPLGLEIGLFGLGTKQDTPHETYATLTWDFETGQVAIGVPRPAYDRVAVSVLDRLAPLSGLAEARMASTRSRVTWGAAYGNYLPTGVALSGRSGALGWTISAHHVGSPALRVVSAGLDWQGGDWRLAAAVEWASDGAVGGKVQAQRQIGDIRLGATLFAAPLPGAADRIEAFVRWQARPRLDLTAAAQVARGSGKTLALLAADYEIGNGQHLTAALLSDGGEAALDFGLGWDF